MTPDATQLLVRFYESQYGLVPAPHVVEGLQSLVRRRCASRNVDADRYVARVVHGELADERDLLLSALTVPETYFLRHEAQLMTLVESIPDGARSARVWSAGCCTGEEPASIVMLLRDHRPDLTPVVIATDANKHYLERAAARRYRNWSLRNCPAHWRQRWFRQLPDDADTWELSARIARTIEFQQHNLALDTFPDRSRGLSDLDAVLCRNVLMYFAPETRSRVVGQLAQCLRPGGILLLGHAEWHLAHNIDGLEPIKNSEACLRRTGGGPLPTPTPTPRRTTSRPPPTDAPVVPVVDVAVPPVPPVRGDAIPPPTPQPSPLTPPPAVAPSEPGWLVRAMRAADAGDYNLARDCCAEAVQLDPLDVEAWYVTALVSDAAGDLPATEVALRRTLYLQPDHTAAAFRAALLSESNGATREATHAARQRLAACIEHMPDSEVVIADGAVTAGFIRNWLLRPAAT